MSGRKLELVQVEAELNQKLENIDDVSEEEAVAREVHEEIGLTVTPSES